MEGEVVAGCAAEAGLVACAPSCQALTEAREAVPQSALEALPQLLGTQRPGRRPRRTLLPQRPRPVLEDVVCNSVAVRP